MHGVAAGGSNMVSNHGMAQYADPLNTFLQGATGTAIIAYNIDDVDLGKLQPGWLGDDGYVTFFPSYSTISASVSANSCECVCQLESLPASGPERLVESEKVHWLRSVSNPPHVVASQGTPELTAVGLMVVEWRWTRCSGLGLC